MINRVFFLLLLLLAGCFRVSDELEPQLNYGVQEQYLQSLPSPFPPLSDHEIAQSWGREDKIALGFAHELDLYQAISTFKRASFLNPLPDRLLQINYDILYCYYLGGKYPETVYTFENTPLRTTSTSFRPYHDLLIILYDSYMKQHQIDHANQILNFMTTLYPETAHKLSYSKLLVQGDILALENIASTEPNIQTLLSHYEADKKSVKKAQFLNAVLPGAGYFYVGQKQTAVTALLINTLFIWASAYFFQQGNVAAGAIFSSFEAGWYFGGIYGAGLEAKFYNERTYERLATPMMNEKRYFPILMLEYGF